MIIAIIIFFVLQQLNASPEYISGIFKNLDQETLKTISESGTFSKWNELGISTRFPLLVLMFIEIASELLAFVKWFPQFINRQLIKLRKKDKSVAEMISTIKLKTENNIELSKSEQKWLKKNKKKED